ncbi:MAG: hypothetical protein M5U09_11535 [Gammaproteobacteria bacterium]|nr:hypothetical protein [Gammaproteobacteria bacterium]
MVGYGDTINRDSLFEFLDLGYFSPFSLPYSNIFRLLDGYRVELEFGLDNESIAERLIESVYSGIGESAGRARSRQIARSRWRREQFAAEFARLLTLDVEERLSPHGRATLCLSSGKDSVLIARILSDAGVSTHIDACHLSSPLFGLDESESVARVANRFALPVEMVTPGADRILTLFDGLHREDSASGNPAWSGIKLLTEAAEGTDLGPERGWLGRGQQVGQAGEGVVEPSTQLEV